MIIQRPACARRAWSDWSICRDLCHCKPPGAEVVPTRQLILGIIAVDTAIFPEPARGPPQAVKPSYQIPATVAMEHYGTVTDHVRHYRNCSIRNLFWHTKLHQNLMPEAHTSTSRIIFQKIFGQELAMSIPDELPYKHQRKASIEKENRFHIAWNKLIT